MKISYKLLWKTLIDKNMGKGEYISMQTLVQTCEKLKCDITDVIALFAGDAAQH